MDKNVRILKQETHVPGNITPWGHEYAPTTTGKKKNNNHCPSGLF